MNKKQVNIGDRYGNLTIIEDCGKDKYGGILYLCKCSCGKERVVLRSNLITGKTKSCGCLQKEKLSKIRKKYNRIEKDYDKGIAIIYATNTNNKFLIDIDDYEKVKDIAWYESSNGYLMNHSRKPDSIILIHRLITDAPHDMVVDHINHNKKDNRKENLRICSQSENMMNRDQIPKGISISKSGGRTYYKVQMCGKYQGNFKNIEDALNKREELLREHYLINGKNYL